MPIDPDALFGYRDGGEPQAEAAQRQWVVTATADVPVPAPTAQAAAEREPGGLMWSAYPAYPDRPDILDLEIETRGGDLDLPYAQITLGPVTVTVYQLHDGSTPAQAVCVDVETSDDNPVLVNGEVIDC